MALGLRYKPETAAADAASCGRVSKIWMSYFFDLERERAIAVARELIPPPTNTTFDIVSGVAEFIAVCWEKLIKRDIRGSEAFYKSEADELLLP